MDNRIKNNNNKTGIIVFLLIFIAIFSLAKGCANEGSFFDSKEDDFNILASYDYKNIENYLVKYGKKNDIDIKFTYMGDIDIVDELNVNSKAYDAVWISNSMWLYLLDNLYLHSETKSLGISPVVFGIKKSKAEELGLINKDVTNSDIVELIRQEKISYVMNSVTQTNTGATAYLGFLTSLAGNPEVLTEEMIHDPGLIKDLKDVFSGVSRVSGDEGYLKEMFLNDDSFEAVISSESSLIDINKALREKGKEELYFIYPTDGVAINDSSFAFLDGGRDLKDTFLEIQSYLLSEEGQKILSDNGIRTWYGGVSDKVDKQVFDPKWGINTSKYLKVTRFPSKSMITSALNLYIEELRKPTHVVFCLDYSGSMSGDGARELISSMNYILDYDTASKDKLQFSKGDKITVITFSDQIKHVYTATGHDTSQVLNEISREYVSGGTALYTAIRRGIEILDNESDEYTKTIIAMTDGQVNVGSFSDLEYTYNNSKNKVPIYSITFGNAIESELEEIAELSNAKVFDGKSGLLKAFKEVRSYN